MLLMKGRVCICKAWGLREPNGAAEIEPAVAMQEHFRPNPPQHKVLRGFPLEAETWSFLLGSWGRTHACFGRVCNLRKGMVVPKACRCPFQLESWPKKRYGGGEGEWLGLSKVFPVSLCLAASSTDGLMQRLCPSLLCSVVTDASFPPARVQPPFDSDPMNCQLTLTHLGCCQICGLPGSPTGWMT